MDEREARLGELRGAWKDHIDNETPFKLGAAESLRSVLREIVEQDAPWSAFFRAERQFLQNQLGWRSVAALQNLTNRYPEAFRSGAARVLAGDGAAAFLSALDEGGVDFADEPALRGDGSRAALASLFLLVADPESHPIYRPRNTGVPLEELLGRKINVGDPVERLERYYRGLDDLAGLLGEGEDGPRHRLDAQGAVWIAKGYGLGILDEAPPDGDETDEPATPNLVIDQPVRDPEIAATNAGDPIDLSEIAAASGISEEELRRWLRALERKGQAILYGPPGTGKTFVARLMARHLAGGRDGIVDLVQFHPAYAYEDFVQGLRPRSIDGELSYEMVPGRLLEFLERARRVQGPAILILDEINRADLSRVFGELMYLLEYRDDEVPLAGGGRLSIPGHVLLIGTMNTADRSIALVDHALRRRFAFLRLAPKLDVLIRFHRDGPDAALAAKVATVLEDLHAEIDDPDLAIGISYFLVPELAGTIEDVWRMEIEPYLEELFFDRADPLGRFSWENVAPRLGRA